MNTKLAATRICVKTELLSSMNTMNLDGLSKIIVHSISFQETLHWVRKVKETLLMGNGFAEITQLEQFPAQKSTSVDSNGQ